MEKRQGCISSLFGVLTVVIVFGFWATLSVADTGNLLKNPGAEEGRHSGTGAPHWSGDNCYGAMQEPFNDDGYMEYARSGRWFWFGAFDDGYAELWQNYYLPSEYKQAVKDAINDANPDFPYVYADFGGWLMSWGWWNSSTPNDPPAFAIIVYDSNWNGLAPPGCGGGKQHTARSDSTDWNWKSLSRGLPTNTDRIRFYIEFVHAGGDWNDGFADDAYLRLKFPPFKMIEPAGGTSSPATLDFGNIYLPMNESAVKYNDNKDPKNYITANNNVAMKIKFKRVTNWWLHRMPNSGSNECQVILEDNVNDVINNLTAGDGTPSATRDAYSRYYALQVDATGPGSGDARNRTFPRGNRQRYNGSMPGWAFKIVQNPTASDEFRYLTFSWRKLGGEAIALQLHGNPDGWDHRYHAGIDNIGYSSIKVYGDNHLPEDWETVTRDLYQDFGEFTLTGISFWPYDGNFGFWDNMYLHKSPNPPYPDWIKFDQSEGTELYYSSEQEVEVSLDLQNPGNYDGEFSLNSINGNADFYVKANAYSIGDAPNRVAPELGQNGMVNVPINTSIQFVVTDVKGHFSDYSYFPGAQFDKYTWRKVTGSDPPGPGYDSTTVEKKNYMFEDAGEYTIYCGWLEKSNPPSGTLVESNLLAIHVRAWDRPTVSEVPPQPGAVSWYSGKYVGVKDEQVRFMAGGTKGSIAPEEEISKYIWDLDNDWNTVELEQAGMAGAVGEFYQYPDFVAQNLDAVEIYVHENNVAPYLIRGFDTVDFPPDPNNHFKHSDGYDTGLEDRFYARFTGFIDVPGAGAYQFHVSSDDGFRLRIAGELVAEHTDTRTYSETTTAYDFGSAGLYPVELTLFQWDGPVGLAFEWTPPGDSRENVSSWSPAAAYTWDSPGLSGKVRCKAVTNYGVQSDEELFDLKIYDSLQVDAGGPYTGRPGRPVKLKGSINKTSYPGAAFKYQWYVKDNGDFAKVNTSSDGMADYAWATDGDYEARFEATVTTSEEFVLIGSDEVFVAIESGRPTTMHGGPYRGGIYGGNFSPVQFQGNPPDFVEAEDVGLIWNWLWYFPDRTNIALQFDGADDYVEIQATGERSVEMWVKPDTRAQMGLYSGDYDVFIYGPNGLGGGSSFDNTFGLYVAFSADNGVAIPFNDIKDGWHYIAVSWDGGTGVRVGVDGQFPDGRTWNGSSWFPSEAEPPANQPFTLPEPPNANATTQIGKTGGLLWGTGSQYFKGIIDEVAVWDVTLTEDDILLHLSLSGSLGGSEPGLIGYWRFDEGVGTTAHDSAGSNDGVLFGMGTDNWLTDGHPTVVMGPPEDKLPASSGVQAPANGFWNATHAYRKADIYDVSLRVRSEYGKWSWADRTQVKVMDGKITGYVRAADLRTPVRNVRLYLTSSHVYPDALAAIATSDDRLNTTADGGLWTETNDDGYYAFERIPLGSFRIRASKVEGETIHEFETNPKVTELTLDTPNQLAIDFVDLSVFPISGRIAYSIQKNGVDVLVKDVVVKAQAIGSTNTIESLPSTRSGDATGSNYRLPLFSGKYLFLANMSGHDIRIKETTPDYDWATGLVKIDRARTDIDFVDYTTRELTVFVQDSGGYKMPGRDVIISGDNGQAEGKSDENDGKFVATLPPGKYTVEVPGADPETREVDVTGGDEAVTMTIPVKIKLAFSPRPKLFDVDEDFLAQFGLQPEDNPEGYMYYYPPEPRAHTYTITATANGNPVEDFTLFVTDEVSMITEDPPEEQESFVSGEEGEYEITAGLPKQNREVEPPQAAPKRVTFRAEKDGYLDSDTVEDLVTVLGDVAVGTAQKMVSVPVVNYTVLHDPPGDGSSSYLDDTMTLKGIVYGMTIKIDDEEKEVPVYPSPWSDERKIEGFTFEKEPGSETGFKDLGNEGLLRPETNTNEEPFPAAGAFVLAAAVEGATGALNVALGPAAYAVQIIKIPSLALALESGAAINYEISPHRLMATSTGSDIRSDLFADINGPGKGDIYFGEGWTLGLQTKYRMGIRLRIDPNTGEPILDGKGNKIWDLDTEQIETYNVLERTNQYMYTVRDIENIISDLNSTINDPQTTDQNEKQKLTNAKNIWQQLLNKNLAYEWHKNYASQGKSFEEFKQDKGLSDPSETLIFSAGPTFEYSRKIHEDMTTSFSIQISVSSSAYASGQLKTSTGTWLFGNGVTLEYTAGGNQSIQSGANYGASWESGEETEQVVGFALNDDDIGDNITAYVYEDPVWGTPLFFQDSGSITSDPWEEGTNKGIDVKLELLEATASSGPFDYNDRANYEVKVTYTGLRELEVHKFDFEFLAPPADNPDSVYVEFNGYWGPYPMKLAKGQDSAIIVVSVSPPKNDLGNSEEKEYSAVIQVREVDDEQITRELTLKPRFADLLAPRANIVAPYTGERVSPVFFPQTDPFDIEVVSNDTDLDSIQLQIRTKQPDGVWEPWRNLSGMVWQDGGPNANVEVFDRLDRNPPRREYTFKWTESEIKALGVGEYGLRAVAKDKATNPNTDIDPPDVVFLVDDSKPTVLTTTPDYQAPEKERIYRGELSALFTDDMRADDFSDRTFAVTDLLKGGQKVAGFVSYSPALRKAIFVPVAPFIPNGFYRVEIKTDTENAGVIERGVHDLAGNPLDNAFMWTFRTKDTPFEETWSITLSVTDGKDIDANNIAAVQYGALDGEDEKDARAVPALTSQLRLSFLDRGKEEFDRDTRPADGRLSHHWFFVIGNAPAGSQVTINYKPSIKLTRVTRQYQVIRLVEFDMNGNVQNVIPLDPTQASINPDTGEILELLAYIYTSQGEASRYFRLDVQKADLVATTLQVGSSGWIFFSAPITPQRADPFVNLGDDIDPFQMYRYDTKTGGYKIYPLDLGELSLQPGHGYFTRLYCDVEVDVGGTSNFNNMILGLGAKGWHAIGNPFISGVSVANLKVNDQDFSSAVAGGLVEPTLYSWKVDPVASDAYETVDSSGKMLPWEGYWLKTKVDDAILTIPAPDGLVSAPVVLPPSYHPPMAPSGSASPRLAISAHQFDLQFRLISSSSSDVTTALGTREKAQMDWDALDQSEPPILGQTVAAYFDHPDWGEESGSYNRDYQPVLNVGEERTWRVTVCNDKPDSQMKLSWEESIHEIPDDVMLYFRCADNHAQDAILSEVKNIFNWQDMREVRLVNLGCRFQFTKITFEIRAHRFDMSPPSGVQAIPGEKVVTMRWEPDDNEFIEGYIITRQNGSAEDWRDGEGVSYSVLKTKGDNVSELVDRDVLEEVTYTYQLRVRFMSGAELRSDLFTVRTLPIIKQTALMQCYPNPFNPEVWIPYDLAEEASVSIEIYSVSGQLVRSLDLGVQQRGRYASRDKAAHWDGLTQAWEKAASGVYFYVLRAGKFSASKKMVLIR